MAAVLISRQLPGPKEGDKREGGGLCVAVMRRGAAQVAPVCVLVAVDQQEAINENATLSYRFHQRPLASRWW